ncbi:hypothetical protein [Streptomyces sp. NPDC058330]|uniref:hypothetical protein n=1 Tax=Streptomyces sp. NPDC058330 TaxID=3346449 RepID=UPI0036EE83CA
MRRSSDAWLLLDQHAERLRVGERQVAALREVAMANIAGDRFPQGVLEAAQRRHTIRDPYEAG